MVSSMEKIESNFFDFCSGIGVGRLQKNFHSLENNL